jgi:hypothetical protein
MAAAGWRCKEGRVRLVTVLSAGRAGVCDCRLAVGEQWSERKRECAQGETKVGRGLVRQGSTAAAALGLHGAKGSGCRRVPLGYWAAPKFGAGARDSVRRFCATTAQTGRPVSASSCCSVSEDAEGVAHVMIAPQVIIRVKYGFASFADYLFRLQHLRCMRNNL